MGHRHDLPRAPSGGRPFESESAPAPMPGDEPMTAAKTVAVAIGGLCTVLVGVLADDVVDISEMAQLGAAAVTAAGTVYAVWRVPNKPKTPVE